MRLSHTKLANIQAKLHPDFWVNSIQFITIYSIYYQQSVKSPTNTPQSGSLPNKANHSP